MAESAEKRGAGTGVGLALGGGVLYTMAGIGVYRALEEAGIAVEAVSGTSGGAIIGAAIASGLPAREVERIAVKLRWHNIAWPLPSRSGLFTGRPLARFVERLTGCRNIEDLKIPFSAVATDINTGEEVRFKEGPLGPAVQASCAIPGLFQPLKMGDKLLVDGGIVDNIPVSAVREFGQRAIVAVDVLRFFEGHQDNLRSGIKIMLKSYQVMVKLISESSARPADLVVMPNVAGFSFTTFHDVAAIIRRGEEAATALVPRLRAIMEEHARGTPPVAWDE